MFGALSTLVELSLFAAMLAVCIGWQSTAPAAETEVMFDLPTSIACRDVTPASFSRENPDQRIYEASVEISTRVKGDEKQIRELSFEFVSPERRWLVHDYYPRTTLEAEYAEPISVTTTHENARSLGGSAGAVVPTPIGAVSSTITPQVASKNVVIETAKRLTPKNAVLVSGTLGEGHGVFFEWKPSSQSSWAGSRIHVIRFIAPTSWQADWVSLVCRTKLSGQGMFRKSNQDREVVRSVGLHRRGSREANLAVERLSEAQSNYLRAKDAEGERPHKSLFGRSKRSETDGEGLTIDERRTLVLEAQRALAALSGSTHASFRQSVQPVGFPSASASQRQLVR